MNIYILYKKRAYEFDVTQIFLGVLYIYPE